MKNVILACFVTGLTVVATTVSATAPERIPLADSVRRIPAPSGFPSLPADTGDIVGRVVDAATGQAIANVNVRLRELGRSELSHSDGTFHFTSVESRLYTVVAERIGYAPAEATVSVGDDQNAEITLRLVPSALQLSGVVVTGTGRERGARDTFRPTTVLADAELRRRLETSLAATIDHIPGISQRYNGSAASQPVIRGMGGDRVLVLEDGQRTGDLSTSGADHAVTIDPISAQRVEVVRGPAGLMYGSNALGGVINVIREEVPRTLPEGIVGSAGFQGASADMGAGGAAAMSIPVGSLALRTEISGRTAGDIRTPIGDLESSGLSSWSAGVGASRIASWGFVGGAVREYDLDYGVPGEFEGKVIPGAHREGVRIETQRRTARVEVAHFGGFGPVNSFDLDANLVHYRHHEIEGGFAGASFDNLFGSANLVFRHEHDAEPVLAEGAFGFYGSGRDLLTGGEYTGSRDASAITLATFLYEELAFEPFRVQFGGRYDWTRITPNDADPIDTGAGELPVRQRTFGSLSASVAALVEPYPGWVTGLSIARGFRTPSIEELFSDGPHLADFSYDIGSPDLEPEIGIGADLFVRVNLPRIQLEASVFRNSLTNYIYHAPTGALDPRFGRFPVFEATGADAVFSGAEIGIQWEAARRLVLDATISGVRASRRETDEPLPAIPPIHGEVGVRYENERYFLLAGVNAAARQNRVPPPIPSPNSEGEEIVIERPTAGYTLVDIGGGIRWTLGERLHTVTVQIDNVTDEVWRDHLSRIKEVAPQPGRNVQLVYRVQL